MSHTQSLFVSRGRTVVIAGRAYVPGELAPIPADDVDRLRTLGFVSDQPPVLAPPTGANPAAIGIRGFAQGPNFRS